MIDMSSTERFDSSEPFDGPNCENGPPSCGKCRPETCLFNMGDAFKPRSEVFNEEHDDKGNVVFVEAIIEDLNNISSVGKDAIIKEFRGEYPHMKTLRLFPESPVFPFSE